MSSNQPDPVAHISDLKELKQERWLELATQKAEILRWMLLQTLAPIGAMAAFFKLFGC